MPQRGRDRAQNVTVCSFRVVDEIDQGMDQANDVSCKPCKTALHVV